MIVIVLDSKENGQSSSKKSVPLLSQAIEQLLSVKAVANLRPAYLRSLRQYLKLFARGRSLLPVDHFTSEDIEGWFAKRKEAPTTRASNLGRLSSLFAFCKRRRWIKENPCDGVERFRLDPKPPQILTLEETVRMVRYCARHEKEILAAVVLGLFAGLRPEEVRRLSWDAIDVERGRLRIDATTTKVRRMRWVRMPANCIAWLKLVRKRSGPVTPPRTTTRRAFRRLRTAMAWRQWPQDILRHTAASYFIAYSEDPGKVARMLGTSQKILLSRYHELVTEEDGEKYSSIFPVSAAKRISARIRNSSRSRFSFGVRSNRRQKSCLWRKSRGVPRLIAVRI